MTHKSLSLLALSACTALTLSCGGEAPVAQPPPPPGASGGSAAPVAGPPGPPATPARPVAADYHGVHVVDDYQWLEKSADPEVVSWSTAENAHARRFLDALPERDALRARVRSLVGASSAEHALVQERGGVLFAMEHKPPLQQRFLVTLKSADDRAGERVVLDPNKVDPSGSTAIDFYVPSLDGRKVAVSLSQKGSENGTLHVYEVASGRELGDTIPHVNGGTAGGSVAWNADGSGVYYTRYPRPGERPPADVDFYQQVWFHKLGTPESADRYSLGKDFPRIAETLLASSDDGKYVLASVQYGDGGEFAQFLLGPAGAWEKIADFKEGIKEARFGRDGSLYLLSVAGAPHGKLLKLDRGVSALGKARLIVPEGESTIQLFEATKTRLYVADLIGGPSDLRAFDLEGKGASAVPILPVSAVRELASAGGDEVLFRNVSFIDPPGWYRFSPQAARSQKTALFQTSPATYDDAEVVREVCVSRDGTKVPLNVLRKKGTTLDGKNPVLLTGYGGYGLSRPPRFNPVNRLWLDRGGVYAVANLRGGGEFGEEWHRAGNLTRKQNVFDDFAACAKHLVEAGYTSPARLAIQGGSNGGLLMGAELTQHPEMFRAVVSHVGIYDMLRVELTPNGAFNVAEYGTVKEPDQFKALHAYSPYHHVTNGVAYPSVLFLTGANDPRVDPFHSRKMMARLQAASSSGHPLLLRVSGDTGHGIGTPLDAEIEEHVDVFSFLFHELGMPGR
jgi:prolyl oligopeptidase